MTKFIALFLVISCSACKTTLPDSSLLHTSTSSSCQVEPKHVQAISACIDKATKSPRQCFAEVSSNVLCDLDRDGLDDNFEDALARSYALVFAYSKSETCWPGNVAEFVKNSTLYYADGGISGIIYGSTPVAIKATIDSIAKAQFPPAFNASNPAEKHGSNFWLCQNQPLGPNEKLSTADLSANLNGGVQLYSMVRPSNVGFQLDAASGAHARYAFVATLAFYPYNEFFADNHEGDWEGGGVFVDLDSPTGAVLGAFYDRHPSTDTLQMTLLGGDIHAIDPATESPHLKQCSDAGKGVAGLRFWDFAGARHHVVIYPSAGGHSGYGYPGTTLILGSCYYESVSAIDSHDGDGLKLVPWLGTFAKQWGETTGLAIKDGVRIVNIGEEAHPREGWAAFRGQWGCHDGLAGKLGSSWPGPFGNWRHCRAWLRHAWGDRPPFTKPNPEFNCSGL